MTPQWKLSVLARFPRPLAVLLIMTGEALRSLIPYAIGGGCLLLLVASYVLLGPLIPTLIVLVCGVLAWIALAYIEVDESLPRREKKDEEAS